MTEEVKEEKKLIVEKPKSKSAWSTEERKNIPSYGCQLLVEGATDEQLGEKNFPSDTCIVSYKVEEKIYKDLTRGPRVNIFDLYYDKFGKGSVLNIDWGNGNVNPAQWGYKTPEKKKKRRS